MKRDDLILKWMNGDITESETEILRKSGDLELLEKIAGHTAQMAPPVPDVEEAYRQFREIAAERDSHPKIFRLSRPKMLRIAASVVLLISCGYLFFSQGSRTVHTGLAETRSEILPDQSEVTLNSQSEIRYHKKKWQSERAITLEGEAFFEVRKGHTFRVETQTGTVTVLGTRFNVKNRNPYFEVSCYEGSVQVVSGEHIDTLYPGRTFRILNGQKQDSEAFSAQLPSWMQQESSFDKIPLALVIEELERQYDLKITVRNVDLNQLFSGSFTHTDKNLALQSVTIPLRISYRIEGNAVTFYIHEQP